MSTSRNRRAPESANAVRCRAQGPLKAWHPNSEGMGERFGCARSRRGADQAGSTHDASTPAPRQNHVARQYRANDAGPA